MANNSVRHAVARSTGATTYTRKEGDEWKIDCLSHSHKTTAPNRGKAWTTGAHPEQWCPKCKSIAAGKLEKITSGRLDLPSLTPKRKRTTKPATKKAS